MKTILFISLFFAFSNFQKGQEDIITLKDGKKVETKIKSHTASTIVTESGTYKFKVIKSISFFTKNYDDLEFYKALEKAGIEVRFTVTPH